MQRHCGERASTLPRIKARTHSSPPRCSDPGIPKSLPTPSASLHLSALQTTEPSPSRHQPRLCPRPSPGVDGLAVASDRRVRSIAISNTRAKQSRSHETKPDVLDQKALLDFSRLRGPLQPGRVRLPPTPAATSPIFSRFWPGGVSQTQHVMREETQLRPRTADPLPNPDFNIQQRLGCLPQGKDRAHTRRSESGGLTSPTVAQRASTQTPNYQTNDRRTSRGLFLSPSTNSPDIEARRRRFDLNSDSREGSTSTRTSLKEDSVKIRTESSPEPAEGHRGWRPTDVQRTGSRGDGAERDLRCSSGDIDPSGLNRLRTCQVAPQRRGDSPPDVPAHRHLIDDHHEPTRLLGNTTRGLGSSSKAVKTSPAAKQLEDAPARRGSASEGVEEPEYVTMYHPGSVYVGEYRHVAKSHSCVAEGAGSSSEGVVKADSRGDGGRRCLSAQEQTR